MTSTTDAVENVTFVFCPPERQVRVEVPLKVSWAPGHGSMALVHPAALCKACHAVDVG